MQRLGRDARCRRQWATKAQAGWAQGVGGHSAWRSQATTGSTTLILRDGGMGHRAMVGSDRREWRDDGLRQQNADAGGSGTRKASGGRTQSLKRKGPTNYRAKQVARA